MARRKKTKEQITAQLNRVMSSLEKKDARFPNLPRGEYNQRQQEAYLKKHPSAMNTVSGFKKLLRHADLQEYKRGLQARQAAAKLLKNASSGQG